MTTTLTDRYVHAATRWLPGRTRTEVAAELRERIADTVAANGDTPSAERAALEELGDPLRVAVDYTGREPTLIGPRLFFPWLRLTVILVAIVAPIVTAIVVLVDAFEAEPLGSIDRRRRVDAARDGRAPGLLDDAGVRDPGLDGDEGRGRRPGRSTASRSRTPAPACPT